MNRKRNDFLEPNYDEEEDDIGRDSDVDEDTRNRALPSKRRKLDVNYEEDSEVSERDSEDENALSDREKHLLKTKGTNGFLLGNSQPVVKPITQAQFVASQAKARKTGVIYVSRVPPFIKPSTIRKLLSPFGEILRIFLTPEPTPVYQKRVRAGGNKKRSFVDGWVEFASKRKAKIVAEALNGNIIGGRKASWYHDDIWNIKYLKGFKWSDLMEQVQNEEREREARLRVEIAKESKERKSFLQNLETDKKRRGMEIKRKSKVAPEVQIDLGDNRGMILHGEHQNSKDKTEMRFSQNRVKSSTGPVENSGASPPEQLQRVLKRIF